jgi:hypothetical protein
MSRGYGYPNLQCHWWTFSAVGVQQSASWSDYSDNRTGASTTESGWYEFRLSLLSASDTVSQIAFVANEDMDGRVVECRTTFSRSNSLTDTTALQVASGSECTRAWARAGASNFTSQDGGGTTMVSA